MWLYIACWHRWTYKTYNGQGAVDFINLVNIGLLQGNIIGKKTNIQNLLSSDYKC